MKNALKSETINNDTPEYLNFQKFCPLKKPNKVLYKLSKIESNENKQQLKAYNKNGKMKIRMLKN